jgi:opacity protein-like surface antigen
MRIFTSGVALALGLGFAASVAAAQEEEKRENETTSFEIAPYAWVAGSKGSVSVRGLGSELGVRFTDMVENPEIGGMAVAKLRLKRWTFTGEFSYLHMSDDAETPGTPFSGSHLTTELMEASLAMGYTMTMEDRGLAEFFAGARAWRIDTDVDFDAGTLPSMSLSQRKTWIDPIVGANFQFNLGKSWYLHAVADVGGFGVSSFMTGQVILGASLRLGDHWRITAAYRYLADDFEDGNFRWKVAQHGFLVGIGLRF